MIMIIKKLKKMNKQKKLRIKQLINNNKNRIILIKKINKNQKTNWLRIILIKIIMMK